MFSLHKVGGLAALFAALAYVIGFAIMATLLDPGDSTGWSAAEKLAFVLQRKALFQAWVLVIYVAFGIALVVLTAALHERLETEASGWMKVATPFGFIWAGLVIASGMVSSVGLESVAAMHARDVAQAVSMWLSIGAIQDGLGGGVEIVGGVWVLLLCAALFRSTGFHRGLAWLGIVIGLSGVLTVVPVLKDLGMVFGIIQIPWFAWLGLTMLRDQRG